MKKVKMHKKLVTEAAVVEKVIILLIACDININTLSQHNYMHVRDVIKVRKKAKIRNRFNQVYTCSRIPYGKVTNTLENIIYRRAKRSALSQQVSTRLHYTDKKTI